MNEENFNWESFTRLIIVKWDIVNCYKLLATPNGIIKWFIGKI